MTGQTKEEALANKMDDLILLGRIACLHRANTLLWTCSTSYSDCIFASAPS
ncbi:hypothetical protein SBA3_2670009 [Candidatus Sulfopaludibacter sp. SbA3]|nr:hypothetical protein SBA3_2670009 [Candidatus Sulfopaludibacter sp. SbA3]